MALGDKPFFIHNPSYDGPSRTPDGMADFYTASTHEHLKDATSYSLYQLHNQTSDTYHKMGEALGRAADSGEEIPGIADVGGTAAKLHGLAQAHGRLATGHFDDAMNRPDRVLNKSQFQRTERLNGGGMGSRRNMN